VSRSLDARLVRMEHEWQRRVSVDHGAALQIEQQRELDEAKARERARQLDLMESRRSPDERACRDGTGTLEQFTAGCADEIARCRGDAMTVSIVMMAAVSRGLPVTHPLAPLGYPPGVPVPRAHSAALLRLARLAPLPASRAPSESPRRRSRREAVDVEDRVRAGVAVSVLGDSVATKLRKIVWVRDCGLWTIRKLDELSWQKPRADAEYWAGVLGIGSALTLVELPKLFHPLAPADVVNIILRRNLCGDVLPPWSDQVRLDQQLSPHAPKKMSELLREKSRL
jgi:hypothetical protein